MEGNNGPSLHDNPAAAPQATATSMQKKPKSAWDLGIGGTRTPNSLANRLAPSVESEAKHAHVWTAEKLFGKNFVASGAIRGTKDAAAMLWGKRCVLNPQESVYLRGWDLVMLMLLLYTAVITPYEVAFLESAINFLFFLNRFVDLLFFKDLCMQFFIAVQTSEGGWSMKHSRIAKHYLTSWFAIDIISIIPFDVLGVGVGSEALGHLQILRVVRLFRLAKLLRIFRASRILNRWEAYISISYSWLSLTKFILVATFVSHWMACFFGLVPKLEANEEANWIQSYVDGGADVDPSNPADLYIASLHWSVMTITTIGYGDISPVTTAERLFTVGGMLLGASIFAFVIGSVCNIVSNMDEATNEFHQTMDALNMYMAEGGLPHDMRLRLRRYFRFCRGLQRQSHYMKLLQQMSPKLRGEVSVFINSQWVVRVPFFNGAPSTETKHFITDIALSLTVSAFAPEEYIVRVGEPTEVMHILQKGVVSRNGRVFFRGSLMGEDMILHDEKRYYEIKSVTYCIVSSLSKENLEAILDRGHYPTIKSIIRRAAVRMALMRAFIKYANSLRIVRQVYPQFRIRNKTDLKVLDTTVNKIFISGKEIGAFGVRVPRSSVQSERHGGRSNPPVQAKPVLSRLMESKADPLGSASDSSAPRPRGRSIPAKDGEVVVRRLRVSTSAEPEAKFTDASNPVFQQRPSPVVIESLSSNLSRRRSATFRSHSKHPRRVPADETGRYVYCHSRRRRAQSDSTAHAVGRRIQIEEVQRVRTIASSGSERLGRPQSFTQSTAPDQMSTPRTNSYSTALPLTRENAAAVTSPGTAFITPAITERVQPVTTAVTEPAPAVAPTALTTPPLAIAHSETPDELPKVIVPRRRRRSSIKRSAIARLTNVKRQSIDMKPQSDDHGIRVVKTDLTRDLVRRRVSAVMGSIEYAPDIGTTVLLSPEGKVRLKAIIQSAYATYGRSTGPNSRWKRAKSITHALSIFSRRKSTDDTPSISKPTAGTTNGSSAPSPRNDSGGSAASTAEEVSGTLGELMETLRTLGGSAQGRKKERRNTPVFSRPSLLPRKSLRDIVGPPEMKPADTNGTMSDGDGDDNDTATATGTDIEVVREPNIDSARESLADRTPRRSSQVAYKEDLDEPSSLSSLAMQAYSEVLTLTSKQIATFISTQTKENKEMSLWLKRIPQVEASVQVRFLPPSASSFHAHVVIHCYRT